MVLEKTLECPLDSMEIQPAHPKGNQPWIFIGRTYAEAKLQYFGHLMRRTDSLEKTLMLGKVEGRRRGQQRLRWLDIITDSMNMILSKLLELVIGKPGLLQSMRLQRVRHDWVTELNSFTQVCTSSPPTSYPGTTNKNETFIKQKQINSLFKTLVLLLLSSL